MSPERRRKRIARWLWLLGLVVLAAAILLPGPLLREILGQYPWIGIGIARVTRLWPEGDMVHVLLFAGLGALTALAFRQQRVLPLACALLLLSAGTEFAQNWIPGRSASWFEFLLDVLAAVGALTLVRLALAACRRAFRPDALNQKNRA